MARRKRSQPLKNRKKVDHYIKDILHGSCVTEIIAKEAEAKTRLEKEFIACLCKGTKRIFIYGGTIQPTYGEYPSFKFVCIGPSNVETDLGKNLLDEMYGIVSRELSPQDYRMTVAQDFMSQYLREIIEEVPGPRALAVELLLYDPKYQKMGKVTYNGDFTYTDLEEVDRSVILVGAYDDALQKDLQKALASLIRGPKELTAMQVTQKLLPLAKKHSLEEIGMVNF